MLHAEVFLILRESPEILIESHAIQNKSRRLFTVSRKV